MLHKIPLLLLIGCGLSSCKESPKAEPAPAPTGCQKDTDCKGTRICQANACVDAPQRGFNDAFPDTTKPAPPAQPGKKVFVRESRLARLQLAKFSHDLKRFAKDNVECPLSLDAVTGEYPPEAFIDPWGNPYDLVCDSNADGKYVTVRSLGGDGQLGTDDDMPTVIIPLPSE